MYSSRSLIKNWRFWFVVIPPFMAWFLIFPFRTVPLREGCTSFEAPLLYSDIEGPGLRTAIADILDSPLNMGWYDLYFIYNVRPSRGWFMTKSPSLLVRFNKKNSSLIPSDTLRSIDNNSAFDMGADTSSTYQIPINKSVTFHYSGSGDVSCSAAIFPDGRFERDLSVPDSAVHNLSMGMGVEPGLVKIVAKTNVYVWVTKLFVLLVLWSAFVILGRETIKFVVYKK